MAVRALYADHLWTPQGWRRDVRLRVQDGMVDALESGASRRDDESLGRFVLQGMPNLHSHASQRAMAGLAERRGVGDDSFWSWRETMYAFASRIGPDELRTIAAQLYVEMLKAGYSHVCEFHYLHHAPDGKPYADPAAMSLALIEAAGEAGVGLTLLPVLYMAGGFDGRPLSERQRRFGMDVRAYLRLLESLCVHESRMLRIGVALHSLRAVPEAAMREVLESPLARGRVVHIHIAEQLGEVEECLALRGAQPVRWLLDHAHVDACWCVVHATHIDEDELHGIAEAGAVAGLCPTTEANLGDGIFPLADYLDAGGAIGIGSDSQISISPVEELRWLEYGQRLITKQRNVAARDAGASVGESLWRAVQRGGAQASGLPAADLVASDEASGAAKVAASRADFIVLDDASPLLAARDERNILDSFVFAGNTPLVKHVMVDGEWVVRDFHHRDEERIAARFRTTVEQLASR
ncbi:MAG: formimidoylglutamate deiminase [Pseudomonadota bacterium]|nr:formimidoylglutamate deiminase [Pseudomonadota bacterium]